MTLAQEILSVYDRTIRFLQMFLPDFHFLYVTDQYLALEWCLSVPILWDYHHRGLMQKGADHPTTSIRKQVSLTKQPP